MKAEKAFLEGLEEGLEKCLEKGHSEKWTQIVHPMASKGMSVDDIADLAGLEAAEIQSKIRNSSGIRGSRKISFSDCLISFTA